MNTDLDEIDLYAMVIRLRTCVPVELPTGAGRYAHALFLKLVAEADPGLAAELHGGAQRRPFTVSTLRGTDGPSARAARVWPERTYELRVTTLDTRTFQRLGRTLLNALPTTEIRIGTARFGLLEALVSPGAASWAGYASFERLLADSTRDRHIGLEFGSPTAFGFGQRPWGKQVAMFPEPDLVFRSLLSKWKAFAPMRLPADLSNIDGRLVVSRYDLRTEALAFPDAPQLGFLGWCRYEAKGAWSEEELRTVNALADFAFYAGVGYKTTMGMGQARRVQSRPKGRSRGG